MKDSSGLQHQAFFTPQDSAELAAHGAAAQARARATQSGSSQPVYIDKFHDAGAAAAAAAEQAAVQQ